MVNKEYTDSAIGYGSAGRTQELGDEEHLQETEGRGSEGLTCWHFHDMNKKKTWSI